MPPLLVFTRDERSPRYQPPEYDNLLLEARANSTHACERLKRMLTSIFYAFNKDKEDANQAWDD